ncbi:MAG TPA: flagellar basal body rod protein FlgB [Acidimicrobiales bacterium]|nr:flagellar basal body rod protein FlgB [Acidimicrobiales bacterium]
MTDPVLTAIHGALRGLSARQRAIADNVANIQTPGYRASRVDFEASLGAALADGGDTPVEYRFSKSVDPTRLDGNNVNLDTESLSATETNLKYQAMVETINAKFGLLRDAIKG